MPVHWYYDRSQLKRDFGAITKYEAPKPTFPGSIMNLSNTGGGGRGSDQGEVVGSVILHGKKHFWKRGGNFHYHHGMAAGENTLDALVTHILTQSMLVKRALDIDDFRDRYIAFMTTPGSHNDVYAGTAHRMFFKNLVAGAAPKDCPDNDGHNVDTIDALMIVPPVVLANVNAPAEERNRAIKAAIQATRKSETVLRFAYLYSEMLLALLAGANMREVAQKAGKLIGIDIAESVQRSSRDGDDPMVACYIDSSFPAMLFFAYKYGDVGVDKLLLASANAGGENVARGSLLGALAGARFGKSGIPQSLQDGLVLSASLQSESSQFVDTFYK